LLKACKSIHAAVCRTKPRHLQKSCVGISDAWVCVCVAWVSDRSTVIGQKGGQCAPLFKCITSVRSIGLQGRTCVPSIDLSNSAMRNYKFAKL
jgi:hypothetical protein